MDRALKGKKCSFNKQLLLWSEMLLLWCPARRPAAKDFSYLQLRPAHQPAAKDATPGRTPASGNDVRQDGCLAKSLRQDASDILTPKLCPPEPRGRCQCKGQCGAVLCRRHLNNNFRHDECVHICSREVMAEGAFCTLCRCEAINETGEPCLPFHKIC